VELERLVADMVCTPIHSKEELGKHYRNLCVIAKFLLSKNHISAMDQVRALLASFEPTLAATVHFRLQ
jgi:hypothetical protein